MADQKVTELPIKGTSGINLADYLFGIDSAEGYQMLISDLAKKIVESYSGSSLAGSARTLKNALDTVASNAGGNMATIESSTTASKAYAVGDYMVRNGQLYKVTAAIASGGTITVGTNVAAAAAADDIAGISNTIGNTAMGTTAQTITGAIAEHEQDISGLNSNLKTQNVLGSYSGLLSSQQYITLNENVNNYKAIAVIAKLDAWQTVLFIPYNYVTSINNMMSIYHSSTYIFSLEVRFESTTRVRLSHPTCTSAWADKNKEVYIVGLMKRA